MNIVWCQVTYCVRHSGIINVYFIIIYQFTIENGGGETTEGKVHTEMQEEHRMCCILKECLYRKKNPYFAPDLYIFSINHRSIVAALKIGGSQTT